MALPASPPPTRLPAGSSTDWPWQPFANSGFTNPFFYHQFADDFDFALGATGLYTATKTGNGTIAHNAGDGGTALFTTNTTTPAGTDICSIQLPAASFVLPTAGKKMFYLVRAQLSDVVNNGFIAGLQATGTTPFTNPADGLFFLKASGSASNLLLRHIASSTVTDLTIPTAYYSLANATNFDLAFSIDRTGTIFAYVGAQLVGYVPQSGTGAANPARGPCASFAPTLSTANLNMTLALQSGTASSKTMTADFHCCQKER